jgi:hypothetical protein
MKYTQWITYKNKTFMFVNCARISNALLMDALIEFRDEYLKRPDCPVLMDLTDTTMTNESNELARSISREINREQDKRGIPYQPTAIIGLTAMRRTVAQLLSPHNSMYYGDALETAREWLYKNC